MLAAMPQPKKPRDKETKGSNAPNRKSPTAGPTDIANEQMSPSQHPGPTLSAPDRRAATPPPPMHRAGAPSRGALRPADRRPIVVLLHVALLLVGSLSVYGATLYPSIPGGDSGELVAAICEGGVAHPPGYPLYVLLGRMWSNLGLFAVAPGMNFFSSLLHAATLILFYLGTTSFSKNPWAAFGATGALAFSPLFWQYSTGAEIFALNNLLVVTLLVLAWRYHRAPTNTSALALFFVVGLGAANQHTIIFVGLPIATWIFWRQTLAVSQSHKQAAWRRGAALIAAFVLGCLPYVYLPLASSRIPVVSWGQTETWSGFWHHFLRRDYGTFRLNPTDDGEGLVHYLFAYGQNVGKQTLWVGLAIAVVGVMMAWRREARNTAVGKAIRATAALYALYVIVFHTMTNSPLQSSHTAYDILSRFWMQPNFFVFFWMALGYASLEMWLWRRAVCPWFVRVFAMACVATQLLANFEKSDNSKNTFFVDHGRAILTSLPTNAILFTKGDYQLNPVRYLQVCEGLRKDVSLVDRSLLTYSWYRRNVIKNLPNVQLPPRGSYYSLDGYRMQDLVALNAPRHPLFVGDLDVDTEGAEGFAFRDHQVIPYGLVNKIEGKNAAFAPQSYFNETNRGFALLEKQAYESTILYPWDQVIWLLYWQKKNEQALTLVNYGMQHQDTEALWLGAQAYEAIAKNIRYMKPLVLKNLGLVYFRILQLDPTRHPELVGRIVQHWQAFLERVPTGDPDHALVVTALQNVKAAYKLAD